MEGAQPPFRPIYNLLQNKFAMFGEYLNESLKKGFIQHLKFPTDAPILFVKKNMVICKCVSIIVN
jgi:hypothetical protein